MNYKKSQQPIQRKVALCYIRLSMTKDASDLTSPQRQRANIQAACDKHGWIPEWYEDAKGHKSATKEDNRPAWLALKARIKDPDVAAIVVNEQSRAMRNAWRAIKLFEELPGYGIVLHLAALDRTIDITTPDGRMTAYFQAFMDDLYALDVARRMKDSVKYRKAKGVSIGIPPFGTIRNDEGYLVPSPFGAWLMPDGAFKPGKDQHQPPHPDALWRGYYECAECILQLYKDNKRGYWAIATQLNHEGWAFRDRWDKPRAVTGDDVRRVTSNWREYAGLIVDGRAKERIAHEIENPSGVLFDTGRAVFDLPLLHDVAKTQEERSFTTPRMGITPKAATFALSHLLYCASCETIARNQETDRLRSRIIGWNKRGELRYRHSESHRCGSRTNSVPIGEIEQDFAHLIDVLDVHPEAVNLMVSIALEMQFNGLDTTDEVELEEQKKVAIAKHRRALKNNLLLFQNGEIEAEDYYRQKDHHERQIAHWEVRTSERQKIHLELTTTMEMVKRVKQFWDMTQGEDRKLLAHSLFDEIVYDLDKRRVVDFKVKSWAEPYLILRAALYDDEMGEEMRNRFNSGLSREVSSHDPTGNRTLVLTLKGSRPDR
jgi:DNA invertase Pin-like site-specific DNA recombinase